MKKLNFGNIESGINVLNDIVEEATGIGWSELVNVDLIDYAHKNIYADDDTEESIKELADQIEVAGLLTPLGVIKEGNRYRLFSGERRYRAITTHLHWDKIPCQVFEGVSDDKAMLMLHMANGTRSYTPIKKLELYEEYQELLERMKANGELKGGIQRNLANLLDVSERQIRTYKTISEQLTPDEKEAVSNGDLSFGEAKEVATGRAAQNHPKKKQFPKKVTIDYTSIAQYLPKEWTKKQMESLILELLEEWAQDKPEKPTLFSLNNSCLTGLSPTTHCGAAHYCDQPYDCCQNCSEECNMRCGWIEE